MIVRIGYVHARVYFDSVVGLRLVNERKYIIVGVSLFLIFDEFRAKSRRSVLSFGKRMLGLLCLLKDMGRIRYGLYPEYKCG